MRKHLLGISGLESEAFADLLENAHNFADISEREVKKVPALRGKTIVNLFLEPSTRTRTSFEIAGKRLSADTINISGSSSSVVKGETLLDTGRTIQAMAPDAIVIRHSAAGAPHFLARMIPGAAVVNAGDGMHEHPTQALLDCLTLMQHYGQGYSGLKGRTIAIVGDVVHSRVARSNILAHKLLGNAVRLVGPRTLVPNELAAVQEYGDHVEVFHNLREGLEGADIVMCLRMQLERMKGLFVPSLDEYSRHYCVSERILSEVAPQAVVLHPGPANRGIEIAHDVLEGQRALVSHQVRNGVAVRMAVLFAATTGNPSVERESVEEVAQ